jgi:protein SCO1/2
MIVRGARGIAVAWSRKPAAGVFRSPAIRRFFAKRPEDFIESAHDRQAAGANQGQQADAGDAAGKEEAANKDPFEEDDNTFYSQRRSAFYIYVTAGVTLVGLYFLMIINSSAKDKKNMKSTVNHVGKANIGGPWKLSDLNGMPFGSGDLDGKYYLIYFGFCRCPDVCPQSLHKLSKALEVIRKSPEKKYFDLETVFVSVDPDRDSKEDIEKFLKHFDKSIIPVTGKSNDDPSLRQMMFRFKIYASKIELEEEEAAADPTKPRPYTLDHTIITYLMDDENQYLTHIGSNMSASETANHIITKIMQHQREKLVK